MKKVAVTGVSGYIGGQTAIQLKDQGYDVVGVDVRKLPDHLKKYINNFYHTDVNRVGHIIFDVDAIVHCAGTSLVGPSVNNPARYYYNNPGNTAKLIKDLIKKGWKGHFVFSSSAATYGEPATTDLLTESSPQSPINPYGQSKLMCEYIIRDSSKAYGFNATSLRYFNACGADPMQRHGAEINGTHLISRICEKAAGIGNFKLYGNDYPTPDGTCIRDYIHVCDIANAHIAALSANKSGYNVFNLGTNSGYSVKEIISAFEKYCNTHIEYDTIERRDGDPAMLVADGSAFRTAFNYQLEHSAVDTIVQTAWKWYNCDIFKNSHAAISK